MADLNGNQMNDGGEGEQLVNDLERGIQEAKDLPRKIDQIKKLPENAKNAADVAKNVAKQAYDLASDPVGATKIAIGKMKGAAGAAKQVGQKVAQKAGAAISKVLLSPPVLPWTILGVVFFVAICYLSTLNPFSSSNSTAGDNQEAQDEDIAEDRGLDADNLTDEDKLLYPVDDEENDDGTKVTGQYSRMASLLYEGIDKAYQQSTQKYAQEKANYANDDSLKTHDNDTKVYVWNKGDTTYYRTSDTTGVNGSWTDDKNFKPTMGTEPELEGNTWDNGDYVTDESKGGAVEQGIAYIIAAYSVSRGNTAPIAVEGGKNKYTYYNGLKEILKDQSVLDGFFEYTGTLAQTEKKQSVKVIPLKQEERRHTDPGGYQTVCPNCFDSNGDNRSLKSSINSVSVFDHYDKSSWVLKESRKHIRLDWVPPTVTETSTIKYEEIACSTNPADGCTQYVEHKDYKIYTRTVTSKYRTEYKFTCPKCGLVIQRSTKSEVQSQLKDAEYTQYKWVEDTANAENKNFTYIENKYMGNIAEFNDEKILEKMFLDDNEFYKDVQGQMTPGSSFMGGVAAITAGQSITLPSGLGGVFTYMGWQMITSPSSNQYKLREAAGMNFNSEGFGIINGRYVIACTTTYGNVGDYVDFYQSDGTVLNCIIGDIKNQNDDGCNQWGHLNGQCVVEFVVDKNSWYNKKNNVGTATNHPELGGKTIVKAVNGGNYFTNPNFSTDVQGNRNDQAKPASSDKTSDKQELVAAIALQAVAGQGPVSFADGGWCAKFVSLVYDAAGCGYPGGNAIDFWNNWKSSGSTDMTNIPIGAAVINSGSNSVAGRTYGHIGIYVGDTDGDGKGEVVHNVGGIRKDNLDSWNAIYGSGPIDLAVPSYPAGWIGWVWPNGTALGEGMDYTGIDPSMLLSASVDPSSLSREQRLMNILASPYYQWGVKYKYECDHPESTESTCPECGADVKIIKEKVLGFLWTKDKRPDFTYFKAEEPDADYIRSVEDGEGYQSKADHIYTVKEKIEYYRDDILDTIDVAKSYESNAAGQAAGGAANGGVSPGVPGGAGTGCITKSASDAASYKFSNPKTKGEEIVNFALQFVGNPYVWGGNSLTSGCDCSGFTQQVFLHFNVNISRTTYTQVNDGRGVTYAEAKPGDIILYEAGNNHHVALYIGDGKIVHAWCSDYGIVVGDALYSSPLAIRRIVD